MYRSIITFAVFCGLSGAVLAQSFTTLSAKEYWGKTNTKRLTAALDTNFGLVTGGVTLSSTASYTDTWGINGSRASQTGQYAVVELMDTSAANYDTDAVTVELFEGVNDSSEATVWGSINTVVDDNTTNTEDSAVEVYIQVAGTSTKALDLNASGATVTALSTGTGEATVDGKYAVVGPDATSGLMVLAATITSTSDAPQTNSFATAFGAAPIVTCTYTEDPGDVQPLYVTNITTTNFVCTVTADKNFNYIAVGQRP